MHRLDMLGSLYPVRDIRLSGQVVYTGNSSMEVAVKMEGIGSDDDEETLMLGMWSPWYINLYSDSTDSGLSA